MFDYATCPRCDTAVLGVVTKGPSHHLLDPCGHRISTLTARELAGNDRPRAMTDGGEMAEVSDRNTDEMTIWELREEFGELQERVEFWKSYEGQEEAWDRRDAVWNALEARTEIEQPECPECGARKWSQSPGDPIVCDGCSWTATAKIEAAVHDAWRQIAEGEEGSA